MSIRLNCRAQIAAAKDLQNHSSLTLAAVSLMLMVPKNVLFSAEAGSRFFL